MSVKFVTMKRCLSIILFVLPVLAHSQLNINKTKAEIKKEITKSKKDNRSVKFSVYETDSTLSIVTIKQDKEQKDLLLQFDKKGNCKMEKMSFSSDIIFKKDLSEILDLKKYEWQKVNENQYVSKFEENIMIELPADDQLKTINIIRMDWTKALYDLLLNN